jgi:inhibitor of cysteine peptidase
VHITDNEEDLMKRFLILVAVAAIFLTAGCAGGVKTYADSGQTINTGVNQEFVIALDSNPTTGYSWQESYDESMLELVAKSYEPGKQAQQGVVGAGGVEYFQFKALKAGKIEITLVYQRPWEEEPIDQKMFTINIK